MKIRNKYIYKNKQPTYKRIVLFDSQLTATHNTSTLQQYDHYTRRARLCTGQFQPLQTAPPKPV